MSLCLNLLRLNGSFYVNLAPDNEMIDAVNKDFGIDLKAGFFLFTHHPVLIGVLVEGQQKAEAWPWSHSWVEKLWWTNYCVRNSASFEFSNSQSILWFQRWRAALRLAKWKDAKKLSSAKIWDRPGDLKFGKNLRCLESWVWHKLGFGVKKINACTWWWEYELNATGVQSCAYGQAALFIGVVQVDWL